jgi:hypothetical protein
MARKQSQGGSRGAKGSARKPKGKPLTRPTDVERAQAGGRAQGGGSPGGNPADTGKVGSDPNAAKAVGGQLDFGAREDDVVQRNYTSANTKAADRGAAQPHAGEFAGSGRTAGAGGVASGPGSSSGGDLDTDFVGVAGGSGLAQAAPRGVPGPDDSDGTAREFASGPPTQNARGPKAGKVEGSTVDAEGDIETTAEGRGAAAVSRPARGDPDDLDDSFVGEVSDDEAEGQDSV